MNVVEVPDEDGVVLLCDPKRAERRGRALRVVAARLPEGTFIDCRTSMVIIRYSYRKSAELVLWFRGHRARCMACESDIDGTLRAGKRGLLRIIAHIRSHDRRKTVRAKGAA